MTKRTISCAVAALVLGLLMVSAAQATLIIAHTDDLNPTGEGFTLSGTAGAANAGPPLNWRIGATTATSGYYANTSAIVYPNATGWTWTMDAKLDSAYGIATYINATYIHDGTSHFYVEVGSSGGSKRAYITSDGTNPGGGGITASSPIADFGSTNPSLAFHKYQIYLDPGPTGATTDDVFRMYFDGAPAGSFTRASLGTNTDSSFLWGMTAGGTRTGNWQYASERLDTGNTVVPEPSSIVLLAAGLIGLLCYAWRKRR